MSLEYTEEKKRFKQNLDSFAAMAAANIQDAVFDDLNYETWAPIAKKRLMENGVWDVVENGVSPDPTKIPELAATIKAEDLARWRNRVIKEMKALKILQSSLTESAFRKTISVASSKDLWDLLKKANEGEGKHIRRLDKQFEDLTMYDGEPMDFYLGRVVDLLDEFRLSGNEKGDDEVIVKLLTSLSWEYDDAIPELEWSQAKESATGTGSGKRSDEPGACRFDVSDQI
ncbi:unnamed protein product [Thlaspi arvense]|uniref:DUF4219 domain-containing protein n=1 Tax=Thlaspi arvense TaxID=13288 RepID=A0AAU9RYY9_THLAR|nr:unnamed protein product [Thlaspi arvense]